MNDQFQLTVKHMKLTTAHREDNRNQLNMLCVAGKLNIRFINTFTHIDIHSV